MRYRPEIDGLRAVAVSAVLLYHAGVPGFAGGFVGVDVFFVISGFLITTIIAGELDGGRFSLLRFYERRARRILPALFAMLALTTPLAWFVLLPTDFAEYGSAVTATILFASNILFWLQSGYFEAAAELNPLIHTWSLAVEEQYYIFLPLIAMACWRWHPRSIVPVLLALAVLSFALCLAAPALKPAPRVISGVFFLLPTRAWELLVGALAGLVMLRRAGWVAARPPALAQALSALGLGLVAGSIALLDPRVFPDASALAPVFGVALLLLFASPATLAGRLLGLRPLVAIGLVSYSLYLWHQPVFSLYRYRSLDHLSPWEVAGLTLLSLILAVASWALVEQPFRSRDRVSAPRLWRASAAGALVLAATGLFIRTGEGLPGRGWLEDTRIAGYTPDNRALRQDSWDWIRAITGDEANPVNSSRGNWVDWFDPADPRPGLLVVGNSHSKDIFNALSQSARATGGFQLARYASEIDTLGQAPDRLTGTPVFAGAAVVMIAARYDAADAAALPRLAQAITAAGKRLVLVRAIHEFATFQNLTGADRAVLAEIRATGGVADPAALAAQVNRAAYADYTAGQRSAEAAQADAAIDAIAAADPAVVVLDRMAYTCDPAGQSCLALGPGLEKTFYDYGHTTLDGARLFGARIDQTGWLAPLLDRAAAADTN